MPDKKYPVELVQDEPFYQIHKIVDFESPIRFDPCVFCNDVLSNSKKEPYVVTWKKWRVNPNLMEKKASSHLVCTMKFCEEIRKFAKGVNIDEDGQKSTGKKTTKKAD